MFEVLVYLFENYFEANIHPDQNTLARELSAAGFEDADINDAFDWFNTLEAMSQEDAQTLLVPVGQMRIYSEVETKKINSESLGFLMFLEQAGVLTPAQRELVIDRAMALPEAVSLEETKWIVLMAMWNQGKVGDYLFVEDALFSDTRPTLH
jgi:Smg protein